MVSGDAYTGSADFCRKLKGRMSSKPEDVIGVRVREKNRVQPLQSGAHGLEPEIGSRVDHRRLSVVNQQDRRPQAIVARIRGSADPAMAGKRGHSHGRAGAKHRKFEYGMRCCGQGGSSIKAGTWPSLASPAAFAISIKASFKFPSTSRRSVSSSGARFPCVFSRRTSSMSIISRAPSRSSTGCPVRGSAYPPSSIAAFCPSERTRFSNTGRSLRRIRRRRCRRDRTRRRRLSGDRASAGRCYRAGGSCRADRPGCLRMHRARDPAAPQPLCGILPPA